MTRGRLEAFSDGVIAIIITIMVLELKVPHEATPQAILALWPVLLSYFISYVFVGIYWVNHHHTFHAVQHVDGASLWANLHLLFWLSLVPFVTGWMGENQFARWPVLAYSVVLNACALSYTILINALIGANGKHSALAKAVGADWKGNSSVGIYVVGFVLGVLVSHWFAVASFVIVAMVWFVPDKRIERQRDYQEFCVRAG